MVTMGTAPIEVLYKNKKKNNDTNNNNNIRIIGLPSTGHDNERGDAETLFRAGKSKDHRRHIGRLGASNRFK